MSDQIPVSQKAMREALELSDEILKNIELSEIPLTNIALKACRLARLLNDFEHQKIFEYEAGGYPNSPNGVSEETYRIAKIAQRDYEVCDQYTRVTTQHIYLESIEQLEKEIEVSNNALLAAKDPDVAIKSANPNQYVLSPLGNKIERDQIKNERLRSQHILSKRKAFLYSYISRKNHELKFSGITDDIFTRIRDGVDASIGNYVPEAVQKLSAVYDGLLSDNPENWSNSVHSCRRILQDLADVLFPAQEDITIKINGRDKVIKLGKDNYINRLIQFIESKSDSERFNEIVGSHLGFMGERLDSVFQAAQKGSHDNIVTRQEADRYVVYTYLIVGDILTLVQ